MKYGLDVPVGGAYADPELLADLAVGAEGAGWDGFFLQDTLSLDVPAVDPWLALAVVASRTRRIRLGVFLTPLSRRRPWQVARQATTIDRLSEGRLTLGAGLGYDARDFIPFGEAWEPRTRAQRLDEGLDVITGLWRGQPFSYSGTHYRLDEAILRPGPVQQPRVPVWVAGGWPRVAPLRRAARWDGIYLMTVHQDTEEFLTPSDTAAALERLGAVRDPALPPLDVAFNPPQGSTDVEAYEHAGVTWWVELEPEDDDPGAFGERIRAGNP